MDKLEAVRLINEGKSGQWNSYRRNNKDWIPDLSNEIIAAEVKLFLFDLSGANLCGTDMSNAITDIFTEVDILDLNVKKAHIDVYTSFPSGYTVSSDVIFISQSQKHHTHNSSAQIFISYTWANDEVVMAIDQWLRNKGLNTRLDKRDFFGGSRIRDEIMRVMQECEVILIFYSKESAAKPWPQFEREYAGDLEMNAKQEGKQAPRIVYIVTDNIPLPNISEKNRLAIMAKGKRFELVCEEIYHSILQLPKSADKIDLDQWSDYIF